MDIGSIHHMQLPREVFVGEGVLGQINTICKRFGFKSVFILTGSHIFDIITKDVITSLREDGFQVTHCIVRDSDINTVDQAINTIENLKPDVVLGIGGGKVIDVAKLAASEKTTPFMSIPTALSHDGISSSRASIKGLTGPMSIETQAPIVIIGDVRVIFRSPYRLTASGCGDIISKYIAVNDWKLAHKNRGEYYGDYAANLALMSAKLIMKYANVIGERKEEGLKIVLEALLSCGVAISIAGSSRPCSGSEHLFSHALDLIAPKPALHGEQCGVGSIMMAYLWKANWKSLKDKLQTIGVPTTAKELHVDEDCIIDALVLARDIRPDRYTILNVKNLDKSAAKKLASLTEVI